MRFSLFVHMERWDESVSHRECFENLTELALIAEAGGFSTVWIGEHHSMEYTISPSPMPQLAYLAARTSTIRLGAGTIIAPFWNPLRVAGETALLDVISNGRMEVGLARGAYQFEFDRMAAACRGRRRQAPARAGAGRARALARRLRTRRRGLAVPHLDQRPQARSKPDPAHVDRRPRHLLARVRRRQRLQRDGDAADEGRRGGRGPRGSSTPPWRTTPESPARTSWSSATRTSTPPTNPRAGGRPPRPSRGSTGRLMPGSETRPLRRTASSSPARSKFAGPAGVHAGVPPQDGDDRHARMKLSSACATTRHSASTSSASGPTTA